MPSARESTASRNHSLYIIERVGDDIAERLPESQDLVREVQVVFSFSKVCTVELDVTKSPEMSLKRWFGSSQASDRRSVRRRLTSPIAV